ncbi:MAG: response regulator transcription factor [Chitinophagaceae bacterium]|nr:response regulator transcription factor [Chitinophagaceae bacterium]
MKPQKILLVDDDKNISEILEFNLKNEGFDVEVVYAAEDALKKPVKDFQLILLDIMMGGMSGLKMVEQLRKDNIHVPVIFLTAKDTENDMLTGFSVGGDDYIAKPFSVKEVIARIRAVLRRMSIPIDATAENNTLTIGQLTIDFNVKEVFVKKEKIALTKTEYELLALLVRKPESLFSRKEIIYKIWSETPYITERTVDVHIARLRKKLGEYGNLITNRSGYGYRFNTNYP